MKKVLFAFLAIVLVLSASSCQKDKTDDKNEPVVFKNEIVQDGKSSGLQGGLIEDYGQADPNDSSFLYAGTNYDIFFYTDNIILNAGSETFSGEGLVLYFESFSINGSGIATGKYTYDATSLNVNTFDHALIYEVKSGVEFEEPSYEVISGSYEVVNNGSRNYEIKGALSFVKIGTNTASAVTFSYKGKLAEF